MLDRKHFTRPASWMLANIVDWIGGAITIVFGSFGGEGRGTTDGAVRRILILRLDGIGDAVITTPFFAAIRRSFPGAAVDCLTRKNTEPILRENPNIDSVFVSDYRWADFRMAVRLRKNKYDIVINPRTDGYLLGHLIGLIVGASRRFGYGFKGGAFLLTDVVPWTGEKRGVQLLKEFAGHLGADSCDTDPDVSYLISEIDREKYGMRLRFIGKQDGIVIAVNPVATHNHGWSEKKFAEVCDQLAQNHNAEILFIGTSSAIESIERIRGLMSHPGRSVAGMLSLREAVGLINEVDLVLTVDSGPRHIANSLGVPAVVLRNGANSSIIWGGYSDTETVLIHPVPCSPCGLGVCPLLDRPCILNIEVETVVGAARNILSKPTLRKVSK